MIEKLLKLAAEGNPQAEYLNDAVESIKGTSFATDMFSEQRKVLEEGENQMPKLAHALGMSLSELDNFLTVELEKRANASDTVKPLLQRNSLGGYAARGALSIGGGALGAVASSLLNDLYNKAKLSVTEKGNFTRMMKHNPDLEDYPIDKVQSIFKTVHRLGGNDLSADPNIAGTIVRNHVMLGDFNKGVDMKSMNELIGARGNLSRGSQTISSGDTMPGLDIYKHHLDAERNSLQDRQLTHNIGKDNRDEARKGKEDTRRETEHDWAGKDRDHRNALDLAKEKREELNSHRMQRDNERKEHMFNLDSRYKYLESPPNKARNRRKDNEDEEE